MGEARIGLMGQELTIACRDGEEQRLADLAAQLDRRLAAQGETGDPFKRLAAAALALVAETQQAGAALARARAELDQLNELLIERIPPREAWRRAERGGAARG